MSAPRDLCYGDCIMLVAAEGGKRYLTARSNIEEGVYFLEQPEISDINAILYDNIQETLFAIYPRLHYEATRHYLKNLNAGEAKKFMLKKRMEAEAETNQKRIERFKGRFVLVGSEVQLYHVYSKGFVEASKEKDSKSPQLSALRLSRNIGSGIIFKIKTNPSYNFKKEGEKISLDDQLYFENIKQKSNIVYQDVPAIEWAEEKKKKAGKSFFGLFTFLKKKAQHIGPSLNYMSIFEKNGLFKQFRACHSAHINLFEAVPVLTHNITNESVSYIRWGDFVRLKHLSEKKKTGTIICEHSVVGSFPAAYLGMNEKCEYAFEEESYSSIFQIVPKRIEEMGKLIQFENEGIGSVSLILRHLLTGRFLNLNGKCSLEEGLGEFHNANPEYVQNKIKENVEKKQKQEKIAPEPEIKGGKLETMAQKKKNDEPQPTAQAEPQTLVKEEEDPLQAFLKKSKIVLASPLKENDKFLSSSHKFFLRSALSENYLLISKEKALPLGGDIEGTVLPFTDTNYFNKIFIGMNPLNRVYKEICFGENGHMMYFVSVLEAEINDIMVVKSLYFPLMKLGEKFEIYREMPGIISHCESSIGKLIFWLCDSSEKNILQIKTRAISNRQKLMREAGIIDLSMKIIHEMFSKKLLHSKVLDSRLDFFALIKTIFTLLYYINQENFPNSIYSMQWYNLLKTLILDDEVSNDIEIERLVISLFDVTDLNVSYQGDLKEVISNIKYEQYNVSAMKLLRAFCSFSKYRSLEDQEDLVQQILGDENKYNIFKPWVLGENNQVFLQINGEIKKNFLQENPIDSQNKMIPYNTEALRLVVELCCSNLGLVYEEFVALFPFEACLQLLLLPKLSLKFKSVIIKFIKACYLAFDFRFLYRIECPCFIKIGEEEGDKQRPAQEVEGKIIKAIRDRYFRICNDDEAMTVDSFNLKHFIREYLRAFFDRNLNTLSHDDHGMVCELIQVCEFLISHKIYGILEVYNLKIELVEFLQKGYVYADLLIKKKKTEIDKSSSKLPQVQAESDHDISIMCEWMIQIIECIHRISLIERDSMVEEFMDDKIYRRISGLAAPKRRKTGTFQTLSKELDLGDALDYITAIDYPETTEVYYYIEFLQLNHSTLGEKVIELLFMIFSLRKNFMDSVNNKILIGKEKLGIFSLLEHLKLLLHHNLRELEHHSAGHSDNAFQLHGKLDSILDDLLNIVTKSSKIENQNPQATSSQKPEYDLNMNISSTLKTGIVKDPKNPDAGKLENEKNLKVRREFKVTVIENSESDNLNFTEPYVAANSENPRKRTTFAPEPNSRFLYAILDEYSIDVREAFQKQELLRKMGLHEQIIEVLAKSLPLISSKGRSLSISKVLVEKSIVLLIFFVLKNETNQELIWHNKEVKSIFRSLLSVDERKLQKLSMILLYELCRDNYQILMEYERRQPAIIKVLNKNYDSCFKKKNLESCIFYFEIMVFFFKIEKRPFFQNQEWIAREIQLDRVDMLASLRTCYKEATKYRINEFVLSSDSMIKVPSDVCLLISGLSFLSQICENSTIAVNNYAKGLFTIQEIAGGLRNFRSWYPLRLELVNYLSQAYIKSKKLEESEFNAIRDIVRDSFIQYMTEYQLSTDPEHRAWANYRLISDTCNIFKKATHYSSVNKQIDVVFNQSEEMFILFGVCEAAYNYFKKLPVKPGEEDAIVLEAYDKAIGDLLQSLESEEGAEEFEGMKEKMFGKSVVVIKGRVFFKDKIEGVPNNLRRKKQDLNKIEERPMAQAELTIPDKKETIEKKMEKSPSSINSRLDLNGSKALITKTDSTIDINKGASLKTKTNLAIYSPNQQQTIISTTANNLASSSNAQEGILEGDGAQEGDEAGDEEENEEDDTDDTLLSGEAPLKKAKKEPSKQLIEVMEQLKFVKNSEKYELLLKNLSDRNTIVLLDSSLETERGKSVEIFPESTIEKEHLDELDYLVGYLIEMKVNEVKDLSKFKRTIQSLTSLIASNDSKSLQTRMLTIKILRRLVSYKKDEKVYNEIQKDLADIGLMKLVCEAIASGVDEKATLEYILGLIDFMNKADDSQLREAFYNYLIMDDECIFLTRLRKFLLETFQNFLDLEKNQNSVKASSSPQLKALMQNKLYSCTSAMEVLRLSCEGHFEPMQNFLREQMYNSKKCSNSFNFLQFMVELLEKYSKLTSVKNMKLGERIVEVLIELVQGPCLKNQECLCDSKLLQVLEDILFEMRGDPKFNKNPDMITSFTNKITVLMISLIEGNTNDYILSKVGSYFSPQLMFQRLEEIYRKNIKKSKSKEKTTKSQSVFKTLFDLNKHTQGQHEEINIEEGFNIYILNKSLQNSDVTFHLKKLAWKQESLVGKDSISQKWAQNMKRAFLYFKRETAAIEIVNKENKLQKIYYRLPKITKYMSKSSKERLLENFPRQSPNDKINGLLDVEQDVLEEMNHFMYLRSKGINSPHNIFSTLRDLNLLVSFIFLFLILFTNERVETSAIYIVGFLQVALASLTWAMWAVSQMPLDLKKIARSLEQAGNSSSNNQGIAFIFNINIYKDRSNRPWLFTLVIKHVNIFFIFCWSSSFIILSLNVAFSILGLTVARVFFNFILLDIVNKSPILRNVIKSISLNYIQLLMTFIFGTLIMYILSVIGYDSNLFKDADKNDVCESLFYCFLYLINIGLRAGGGVGEILDQPSFTGDSLFIERFFYDLSFFIIITVIWLKIIFGIIIDTFAELRDSKKEIEFDKKYRCYICNLERTEFEKEGVSFNIHTVRHHNLWNYLYFVIYLRSKNPNDFNGIESYVFEKINRRDISWLPIGRTLDLKKTRQNDSEIKHFEKQIDSLHKKILKMRLAPS